MLRSLIFLGALACAAPAQTQVKITLLGDSILLSFSNLYTPRYYLYNHLTSNNYAFDFIGHNSGVFMGEPLDPNFDQDVEAYPGWQVDHILLFLYQWMVSKTPDIVVINLGTNDLGNGESASSTAAQLGQCIDVIRSVNPVATVLVSQLLPRVSPWVPHEQLNALIPGMVAAKDTPQSRVAVVDCYTSFDPVVHLGMDGLHPNEAGETLLGQIYYDALRDFMTPIPDEFTAFGSACSGTAPIPPAVVPIRGQAASLGNLFSIEIEDIPVGAIPFSILGFDPVAYYAIPLPIDLSVLGATGCQMFVGPDLSLGLPAPVGGKTLLTLDVPDEPLLIGGTFYHQAAALAAGLNPLGLIFSDAAAITVVEGQ